MTRTHEDHASTRRRRGWWALVVAGVCCLLLNIACIPFYSGSSITPSLHWRLEHGRLTVRLTPVSHTESFYIALNSEGLRWAPSGSFSSIRDWSITAPLWLVWAPAAALIAERVIRKRKPAPIPAPAAR